MKRNRLYDENPSPNRFYRDTDHGLISGVCAGIADYFGLERWVVRMLTVVIFIFYSLPVFLFYLIASFVVEARPQQLYKDENYETFWREVRKSPRDTFGNTRFKFRELDKRLQEIERYLTSRKFKLNREFDDLMK